MDSARALLEAGANINALSDAEYGDSALTCAVRGGHYDIAHMLIEAGADLEAGGQDIGGALSSAAFGPQAPENAEQHRHLLRTLIARGADKNAQDNYFNWTPLYCAALGDYVDGVNILLEAGADINLADSHGNAPVYTAAQKGHTEIVQLLIDAGADMSVLSKESYIQPLNDIVEKGDTDMLKILLDAGAMPRVEAGFRKLNPLHIAAQKGDWEAAELLIKADRKLMFMEDRHGRRPYQHVKKNRKLKHLLKP